MNKNGGNEVYLSLLNNSDFVLHSPHSISVPTDLNSTESVNASSNDENS